MIRFYARCVQDIEWNLDEYNVRINIQYKF